MKLQSVLPNNKLGKTKHLIEDGELRRYVPDTLPESRENLRLLLDRYGTVYVKPNHGTGGHGVMRARITSRGTFRYQLGKRVFEFPTFDEMYRSLHNVTSQRTHLVQMGIPLLKYEKRPFDIRIMVQKNPAGQWENTGIIARVAHPQKIVTNYHSGGTPMPLEKMLKEYLDRENTAAYMKQLGRLGVRVAEHLHTGYPFVTAVGVDVGLDGSMKPWIIEVNTRPDPYIFKKLNDRAVFRKIIRYLRVNRKRKPQ